MDLSEKLKATIRTDLDLSIANDLSGADIDRWIKHRGIQNTSVADVRRWLDGGDVESPRRGMLAKVLDFDFKQAYLEEALSMLETHVLCQQFAHEDVRGARNPAAFAQMVRDVEGLFAKREARTALFKLSGLSREYWWLLSNGKLVPDTGKLLIVLHTAHRLLVERDTGTHLENYVHSQRKAHEIKGYKDLTIPDALRHISHAMGETQELDEVTETSTQQTANQAKPKDQPPTLKVDLHQLYTMALQGLYGPLPIILDILKAMRESGEELTQPERFAAIRFLLHLERVLGITEAEKAVVRDGQPADAAEMQKVAGLRHLTGESPRRARSQ